MLQVDYYKYCNWTTTAGCGQEIFASETQDRELYGERFEIVLDEDISFRQQFVPVIQVAESDLGGRLWVGTAVHGVADDDIVGRNGDIDGQRFFVAEFVVLDGIFHQGLQGDGGDQKVFGGQIGDLDDHDDGVGEADLEQVEIVTDEFDLLPEEDQVSFLIAQDITVDPGEGIVIQAGVLRVAGNEEG